MDNPKAARDIIVNNDAVYGYSPNLKSPRIGEFSKKIDWTNKKQVEIVRKIRQEYHNANKQVLQKLYKEGYTTKEIAEKMVEERNKNRLNSYIQNDDMEGLKIVKQSNLKTYGNEAGMTFEQALKKEERLRDNGMENGTIMERYASIKNPLEIGWDYGDWHGNNVAQLMLETELFEGEPHEIETNAELERIIELPEKEADRAVVKLLKSLRYDGQAIVSLEINTVKDIGSKYEYYNVVVTVFDLHKNYIKSLFKKYNAKIKYKKETLPQVNPQLHEWLGIFNESVSGKSISYKSRRAQGEDVR